MLGAYILVWPVIAAVVLVVIVKSFVGELREARKDGKKIV
ncbi:MAG: putative transporter small subunit [Qingshengfaniella sp.]